MDIAYRIDQLKQRVRKQQAEQAKVAAQLVELKHKLDVLSKVKKVLLQAAITGRASSKSNIEQIITDGLRVVHEHDLAFIIKDSTSHGKAGCTFKLKKNNKSTGLLCFGGGIRNIVSTILRFIFAEYAPVKLTMPLVLDEVGNNISKEYQDRFGEMLSTLSRKFDRQVILISHQQNVIKFADHVIKLNCQGETSECFQ